MGKLVQELCHVQDLPKLSLHLKETLNNGHSLSKMFRFMMSKDKYIHVQTKSKLFTSTNPSTENDFIMTTYSIIGLV